MLAHIWVLAYTAEPIVLFLIEPRGKASQEPLPLELRRGPILDGLKRTVALGMVSSVTLSAFLFINPQFLDTRWPWLLDPFDARVMVAFFTLTATWCAVIYFSDEWAEVRLAALALAIFAVVHFFAWLAMLPGLDPARHNVYTYGIVFGIAAILLTYYYIRQEYFSPKRVSDPGSTA